MSIVPLNFGAAAPLMLNPHFVQVVAVSGFFVPQFGQNKTASESSVAKLDASRSTLHARRASSKRIGCDIHRFRGPLVAHLAGFGGCGSRPRERCRARCERADARRRSSVRGSA
jgi:hypothetical protein